jgi:hypothetical protein
VPRFRPPDSRDALRSIGIALVFVAIILVVDLWIRPRHGLLYSVVLVGVGLYTVVVFNSRAYGYRCSKCRHVFQASGLTNFVTPNSVGKNPDGTYYAYKWMVCPRCHKRAKAVVLRKADFAGTGKLLKPKP